MPSPKPPKPSSYLPDDWETATARGMFAKLKPRNLDPVAYDKKVEFWTQLIAKYCLVSKSAVADFNDLKQKFRKGNLIPAPLEAIMEEMHKDRKLQTLEEFKNKQGWLNWGLSFLTGPSKVNVASEKLAHIPTVEILAKELKNFQKQLAEEYDDYPEVIAFDDLKNRARHIIANDDTFEFAVEQLMKWGDLSQGISKSGERVLKFAENTNGPAQFTETDASIHEIRRAMTKIENELKRLETKEAELKEDAKRALHNRNKQSALNILKKKKRIEKEIQMKDGQYCKLLEMLEQIAQTRQTKEVLEAYKAGNKAFKEALGRQGLTVDNIDQTVDSIHDIIADFKEVDDALANGFKTSNDIDEDELSAELDEMMEADKEAERNNRVKVNKNIINIGDLPEVPTSGLNIDDSIEQRLKKLREAA